MAKMTAPGIYFLCQLLEFCEKNDGPKSERNLELPDMSSSLFQTYVTRSAVLTTG